MRCAEWQQRCTITTEVQTFIHGAKRELAREMPNPKRMGEAAIASRQYQLKKAIKGE